MAQMKEITDMKPSLGKFMTLFVLGVLAVLNSCTPAQIREAESVIERTFGSVPSNVEFSLLEKEDSLDMYAVSVHDGCLKVEGTSSIALCKGFYDFILENGYGIASWTGNRLEFPEFLADCPRKEVRRLVSTWSGSSLRDYSARVWSGLIRDYYVPRLDYYFENAVKGSWVDVLEFDRRFHDAEGGSADASSIQPYEDPLSAACELVMKYSSLDYSDRELNPYSPDREVTYWCPQDFGDKKTKRLYMTIHAADFAKMKGLKIRGVRGSDVRISRLEVKSGPQWLGNRELNLLVKSSGDEKKIPFKGPGTTDGLEREVGIYLTIEGGPQTWGTISLY